MWDASGMLTPCTGHLAYWSHTVDLHQKQSVGYLCKYNGHAHLRTVYCTHLRRNGRGIVIANILNHLSNYKYFGLQAM